jgi:hypothetical protein
MSAMTICAPTDILLAFDKEASQTCDYCVAKNATQRAARLDPSLRKERLFRMTIGERPSIMPFSLSHSFQALSMDLGRLKYGRLWI